MWNILAEDQSSGDPNVTTWNNIIITSTWDISVEINNQSQNTWNTINNESTTWDNNIWISNSWIDLVDDILSWVISSSWVNLTWDQTFTGVDTTSWDNLTGTTNTWINLSGDVTTWTDTWSSLTWVQTWTSLSCSLSLLPSTIVAWSNSMLQWIATWGNTHSIDNWIWNVWMSWSKNISPTISSWNILYNLIVWNWIAMISCSVNLSVLPNYIDLENMDTIEGSWLIITWTKDLKSIFEQFNFTGSSSLRKVILSWDYYSILTEKVVNSWDSIEILINSWSNLFIPLGIDKVEKTALSWETQLISNNKKTTISPKISIWWELPIIMDNYATIIYSWVTQNIIKYGYRQSSSLNWNEVNLSSQSCEPIFPNDCWYMSGNSLIIKTYHFTQFAVISEENIVTQWTNNNPINQRIETWGWWNIYSSQSSVSVINNAIVTTWSTSITWSNNYSWSEIQQRVNKFIQSIENKKLTNQQKISIYNKILDYSKILKITRPTKIDILNLLEEKLVVRIASLEWKPLANAIPNTVIIAHSWSVSVNIYSWSTLDISFRPVIHTSKKKIYIIYKKAWKYIFKRWDWSFSDETFNSPMEIVEYIDKHNK